MYSNIKQQSSAMQNHSYFYTNLIQVQVLTLPSKLHPQITFFSPHRFSSVQSLSHVRLFATPWITARQASLSITNSRSSLKLMSIESVMPSSHLILCRPLLLPPIPPSIRVFSNKSTLLMRWPKYWSFSFSISCRLCINSKEENSLVVHWLRLCTFTA